MGEVAMFPLGTVLFPYMPMPLRIFEERYRIMLGRLLDAEVPEFGVVLIERGREAGGGADSRHFTTGTMARITGVAAGESDIRLVTLGSERIEVDEWLDDAPYPRAIVHALPSLEWDSSLSELHEEAERTVRRLLSRAGEFADLAWDPEIGLSDDPAQSSWQLAGIAPLSQLDQLALLRSTSLRDLLTDVIARCADVEPVITSAAPKTALDAELADLLGDADDPPEEE